MKRKKKKLVESDFKIPYQAMKKIRKGQTVYHKNVAMLDRSIHDIEKLEREVMNDVMDSLLKEEPFDELTHKIVEKISRSLDASSYGIVYFKEGEEPKLNLEGGEPEKITHLLKDGEIFTGEDLGISSETVVIPLKLWEDTIIAITFKWKDSIPSREIFEFLKEKLEKMLKESSRLREMFEERYKDHLTGLLNRKAFDRDIKELNGDYSLIFIDVDDFKKVNDTYGHDVGDEVLVNIAKTLKNSIRSTDRAYRFGGDEFVVILPGADCKTAKAIAKRIESSIESAIRIDGNPISVSCGVASSKDFSGDILKEADRRMYVVKGEKKKSSV